MPKQSYLADVKASIDAEIAELEAQGGGGVLTSYAARPQQEESRKPGRTGQGARAIPPAWPDESTEPSRREALPLRLPTPEELARIEKERKEREAQAKLERRLTFLTNLRRELDRDPQLVSFIDSMVGNQVKAAERRQRMYSAVIAVVSLLVGWLLSGISPATTLANMLPH